jgi:DNA replicative helicase MCM subunit Mcm2 (Cdc46/Mcm family)
MLIFGLENPVKDENVTWDFDELRLYLNYARSLEPCLTNEANIVIQK